MRKPKKNRRATFSDAPQWFTTRKRAQHERKKRETLAEIAFLRKINY